jgi:hypothetical protein
VKRLLVLLLLAFPATASAACPTAPDPAALPDAAALKSMTRFEAKLGARPTGSVAHQRFVQSLLTQLRAIPGVKLSRIRFRINRWTATKAGLRLDGKRIPIAGPVPYSRRSGRRGISGDTTFIPEAEPISAANASGRIVVRPAPRGVIQNALLALPIVSYETYDPEGTIDPTGNLYGDFIAYNARVKDLRDARAAGAKALIFVKDRPVDQLKGHIEPYEGTTWGVPALFVGADEGALLEKRGTARVTLRVKRKRMRTPSLIATLPGQSRQKLVVESHTDGTNAAEDNGPVAMIAMARYFAALPLECRPRTLVFAFSTGHFYQRIVKPSLRHGGSGELARRLDREYDQGLVSAVVVIEHLGAIDYEGVPRTDGPGVRLEPSGLRAIQFIAITQSPSLVAAVDGVVRAYDLQRTLMLQGADAPGTTVPSHCSFGGEGTPYNQALLPTVAAIAAPQSLYDPPFGLEGIDFSVMRDELLAFTELVNRMGVMSQAEVAGSVPLDRARRDAGMAGCPAEN